MCEHKRRGKKNRGVDDKDKRGIDLSNDKCTSSECMSEELTLAD